MTMGVVIAGVIMGIIFSIGWSFYITMKNLRESNDIGDSKGNFAVYTNSPVNIRGKKDRVSPRNWQ